MTGWIVYTVIGRSVVMGLIVFEIIKHWTRHDD